MSLLLLMTENGWLCLTALVAVFALLAATRDGDKHRPA